ncbi:hypothetical protein ACWD6T_10470 [Streptomyces albidoflavus]
MVAALREAETRLDVNQDAALEELTGLLVRIAASSAAGRIGALLPESVMDLQSEPVRSHELLRITGAVVIYLGGIVGVSLWELPDAAAAAVIAGAGLLSAIVAFGSGWRRVMDLLP